LKGTNIKKKMNCAREQWRLSSQVPQSFKEFSENSLRNWLFSRSAFYFKEFFLLIRVQSPAAGAKKPLNLTLSSKGLVQNPGKYNFALVVRDVCISHHPHIQSCLKCLSFAKETQQLETFLIP